MSIVLVVAPHADDESLGCGGTLLRHIANGDEVHWLLVTGMSEEAGFTPAQIQKRQEEIATVTQMYGFASVIEMQLPPAQLDKLTLGDVIGGISGAIKTLQPETIYTVYRSDAHTDHQIVFDAVASCSKTFRYPCVKKLLCFETVSETDFSVRPEDPGFRPNYFVDISAFLERKLEILAQFESEMGEFPFPRSNQAITALSQVRGAQAGVNAAEAFMLLKEVVK